MGGADESVDDLAEPGPSSRTSDSPVVDRLREEHARTRTLLRRASALIRWGGPDDDIVQLAHAMEAYFLYWNPLHEVDEEQSVAPALYAYAPDDATREIVARMTQDHTMLDARRDEAARVWHEVAMNPATFARVREEMRNDTRELTRLLARHIAWEEREIFPRVRIVVPRAVQQQIVGVMKARRGEL